MFCLMLAFAILAPRRSGCHANHRKCRHGRDVAQHLWRWGLGSESASPPTTLLFAHRPIPSGASDASRRLLLSTAPSEEPPACHLSVG